MNELMNEWTKEWINKKIYQWNNERKKEWTKRLTKWTNEQINQKCTNNNTILSFFPFNTKSHKRNILTAI